MAIVGWDSIGSADVTLIGGTTEVARLQKTPAGEVTAASGDTATLFSVYVKGGSGADSTINFGLYAVSNLTDPSGSTRIFTDSLLITAANTAAPGWYTKVISVDLTAHAGSSILVGFAGVAAGTLIIAAQSGGASSSEAGTNTLPSPWGASSFASTTRASVFITTTAASGGYRSPLAGKFGALLRGKF